VFPRSTGIVGFYIDTATPASSFSHAPHARPPRRPPRRLRPRPPFNHPVMSIRFGAFFSQTPEFRHGLHVDGEFRAWGQKAKNSSPPKSAPPKASGAPRDSPLQARVHTRRRPAPLLPPGSGENPVGLERRYASPTAWPCAPRTRSAPKDAGLFQQNQTPKPDPVFRVRRGAMPARNARWVVTLPRVI